MGVGGLWAVCGHPLGQQRTDHLHIALSDGEGCQVVGPAGVVRVR